MFRFHQGPNHNPNLREFRMIERAQLRQLQQCQPLVREAIASATRRSGIGCSRLHPSVILFVHLPVTIGLFESE